MKKIILAILLVALPAKAYCSPSQVSGAGNAKCSEYNSQSSEIQSTVFFTWMQGFLSAFNVVSSADRNYYIDIGNPTYNYTYQKGILDMLCQQNPDQEVYLQGLKILLQLQKMGLTVNTPN